MTQIAIIGGGASGTITAIQLLRNLKGNAKVFLLEKRESALFRGAAYSSQLPYEPLNVQAGRMSMFNHLPDDFFNWLKINKQSKTEVEITKDSFVSRRWFGDYLTANFEQAKQNAKEVQVEIINSTAHDLDFDVLQNGYFISLDNNRKIFADYIVFACGNEQPSDILQKEEIDSIPNKYVSNPWAVNPFSKLKQDEDVLFIGTGLTSVDHLVSLHKQNHRGKIFCFSRNGYLPLPHAPIQHFVFDAKEEPTELKQVFEVLQRNIQNAETENIRWQNVIDALRPHTARIWKRMSVDSKKYFLKRLRTYWEIHRHRMPLASAQAIQQMKDSGQLKIISGNFKGVVVCKEEIQFQYFQKEDRKENSISIQQIINCTGPSNDYHQTENTLFKNLLQKGWMKQDELKLGIETGARGEIIKSNGVVLHKTFAVGPVRKAMEWESTAIREIRTQAENVAIAIARPIDKNYEIEEVGL